MSSRVIWSKPCFMFLFWQVSLGAEVALYNAYPSEIAICFELGQSWSQRSSERAELGYGEVVHLKFEGNRPLYVTAIDCEIGSVQNSAVLWLTDEHVNLVGWGTDGSTFSPSLDLPPTNNHGKVLLTNDAKGFGSCRWITDDASTAPSNWVGLGTFSAWNFDELTNGEKVKLECEDGNSIEVSLSSMCADPVLLGAIGDASVSDRPLSMLVIAVTASCDHFDSIDDDNDSNDSSVVAAVLGITSVVLALFVLGLLAGAIFFRIAHRRRMERYRLLSDHSLALSLIARPANPSSPRVQEPSFHSSEQESSDLSENNNNNKPPEDDDEVVCFVDTSPPPTTIYPPSEDGPAPVHLLS